MEDNNSSDRYREDKRPDGRNFDMNWDRDYHPGDNDRRINRNVSADRESRNRPRNYSDYDRHLNDPNDYRNQRYSDRQDNNFSGRYQNQNNYGYNDRGWWDKTKDEVASWFGNDEPDNRRNRDEMREGPHKGKGPKNYTRSEERIKEDVSDHLSDDSFLDATGIEVSVKEGDVTLNGVVDSRYSKHRAEDLAEDVTGVKNVQNNLRVVDNAENSIFKNSANNGNKPITNNTNYTTTKNRQDSLHG